MPPNHPVSETCHRRRIPFKHLSRQRSFSLESRANVSKPETTDAGRKCVSLKSSPLISAHVSTLPSNLTHRAFKGGLPLVAQKQYSTPERSIMAELRRSSEIFKSILLNLSIKENESVLEVVHSSSSSIADNEVDIESLVAAHKQRCVENYPYFGDFGPSSSSSSSLSGSSSSSSSVRSSPTSSPDRSSNSWSDFNDRAKTIKNVASVESYYVKVNTNIPAGKLGELSGAYTREFLYRLPPIFLATIKGNKIAHGLLLKYGADANYQVGEYEDWFVPELRFCYKPGAVVVRVH